jgi:hypothetical protein
MEAVSIILRFRSILQSAKYVIHLNTILPTDKAEGVAVAADVLLLNAQRLGPLGRTGPCGRCGTFAKVSVWPAAFSSRDPGYR